MNLQSVQMFSALCGMPGDCLLQQDVSKTLTFQFAITLHRPQEGTFGDNYLMSSNWLCTARRKVHLVGLGGVVYLEPIKVSVQFLKISKELCKLVQYIAHHALFPSYTTGLCRHW